MSIIHIIICHTQQHTATNRTSSASSPPVPHHQPFEPLSHRQPATSYYPLTTTNHQVSTMREKPTSRKLTVRESDIINVDDSSSHSGDSAGSIRGAPSDPAPPLENHMPPPPNHHSRLMALEHSILDSREQALGVSLAQPPPKI